MKINYLILQVLILLSLCHPIIGQIAKGGETGPLDIDEIYDLLRLDVPEEPLTKINKALIHGVHTRGIAFELTEAITKVLRKDHANEELIAAIRQESEKNKKEADKIEAKRFFGLFEACDSKDYNCQSTNLDKAIPLDPTNKLYSDWRNIVRNQLAVADAAKTPPKTTPSKGKNAGKILYMGGDINSSKSVLGTIDGLLFTREFNSVFPARLKDAGLELLTVSDLSKADRDKLFNRLRDRSKDERSLQFLPVALVVHVVFSFLKDLDEAYGLKASEVTGYVEVIDNENGRTVLNHNFTSVRGFGSTQDDARRNAFKEVANGVLNTFIKAIKEESK